MEFSAILNEVRLFSGMETAEIVSVLKALSARSRRFRKGETLFLAEEQLTEIGIVLEGSLSLTEEDYWGNRTLLTQIGEKEVFGETFACLSLPLRFDITATEDSLVLFLRVDAVLEHCACHQQLTHNLLLLFAEKNLVLSGKARILSRRSTRAKLMEYLSAQAKLKGSPAFTIPFDRQQLADYLSVDRSAMSAELGRMAREGILSVRRNHFTLL